MYFKSRRLVKPEDLNPRRTLFGGRLLQWIDEEAAIFCMCQLETKMIVTKLISEINFVSPAFEGDVVKIGFEVVNLGTSSITLACNVINKETGSLIVSIDKIVFVSVDLNGKSKPHGVVEPKTEKNEE